MNLKNEKTLLTISIVAILFILTLPSLFGYAITSDNQTYTGLRSFVPGDIFVYYSYIEQIKQGNVLLEDLYTIEEGVKFINVFWQSVGYIGKLTNADPGTLFLSLRILFGAGLLFVLYKMIRFFRTDKHASAIPQFLFTVFMGGVGPYFLLFHFDALELNTPMDVWVPEQNFIISLIASPHFIVSTMLIALIMLAGYIALTKDSWRYSVIAGFLSLFLFQFHPYYIPLIYGVLGIFYLIILFREKTLDLLKGLRNLLPLFLISLPSILYHLYLLNVDEIFLARAYKNILPLPDLHIFFISFGVFLPLAFLGLYAYWKKEKITNRQLFISVWFIAQGILIFLPISFQRKLVEAWMIPGSLLAWEGLLYIKVYIQQSNWKKFFTVPVVTVLIILFIPSTYFNLIRDYLILSNSDSRAHAYGIVYVTDFEQEAYDWLRENITVQEPILSHINSGLLIPAYSGRRVYIGHWSETLYAEDTKIPLITLFFDSETEDVWRIRFLKNNDIAYLWWGSHEKRDFDFAPEDASYLEEVFLNDGVTIYRITIDE